ncbi:MMPL family transporter [Sanguibacter suaedae]|uniref:MMPL family transporter n=1 Tax=Sanguibacter suaedae TaxID=2795737 RepID=A0A934I2B1_9MICO|nr:MMPL family transporter [Sanguibacter suaedae]MBI9113898.1 MMPL family transporter [Sanguibacter suaedae]
MASFLYRVGRGSFTHRWIVLGIWLLAIAAIGIGAVTSGLRMSDTFTIPGTESATAQDLLVERFGEAATGVGAGTGAAAEADEEAPASTRVVIAAPEGESLIDDGGIQVALGALAPVAEADGVVSVSDPTQTGTVAPDGSVLYVDVQYDVPTDDVPDATHDAIVAVEDTLEDQGYTVALTGGPFTEPLELLSATELVGVVVALVVLLVTFGSLLAAGMPILTAILGVATGVGGVLALSAVVDISSATLTLALMLGLAVGIDYALFLLSRHRQQLAEGLDPAESAGRAVGTAGSAVVFAGLTVVIALSGLAVTGIPFLSVMGYAAAATVAVAVLIAVTLLPALMGFAGTRLVPRGRAKARAERSQNAENRWGTTVTKHPVITLVVGTVLLGLVAIPALSMRLGLPDAGQEPLESSSREAYDLLADGFGAGINGPLVVLVDAADDPAALMEAATEISEAVAAVDHVAYVAPPMPNGAEGADAALVLVVPETGPNSEETADVVHDIRDLRPDLEASTGVQYAVTGAAAANIDVTEKLAGALPLFLAVVVGLALVLLLVAFRSILVPVTAVLGFLLTVAAAFGATTAVYQWGWLADVFSVSSPAPLLSFMPVLLVGILFGLAMDYQVFLVSRMREDFVHGAEPLAAVRSGYAHGARVVLAAALIMIAVFASFVFSGNTTIAPIAFAMGVGIAFDALIVRMTMIPAVMALLGGSAWWLPRWLDKALPRVDIEGTSLERSADVPAVEAEGRPAAG